MSEIKVVVISVIGAFVVSVGTAYIIAGYQTSDLSKTIQSNEQIASDDRQALIKLEGMKISLEEAKIRLERQKIGLEKEKAQLAAKVALKEAQSKAEAAVTYAENAEKQRVWDAKKININIEMENAKIRSSLWTACAQATALSTQPVAIQGLLDKDSNRFELGRVVNGKDNIDCLNILKKEFNIANYKIKGLEFQDSNLKIK